MSRTQWLFMFRGAVVGAFIIGYALYINLPNWFLGGLFSYYLYMLIGDIIAEMRKP